MKGWLQELARRRWGSAARGAVVALGICLFQAILYGPSLVGVKILLPVDILAAPRVYIPGEPGEDAALPHNPLRSDLVFFYEPERQFALSELHAGRLPFWTPHRFAGAPCFRWSLSPPRFLGYLIASPVVLAWSQLLVALIAGTGAYLFFRRVLRVGFWPGAITAWCYPLSGAYVVWQGFPLPAVMCWLPWMLLAVDAAVCRPFGPGGPLLAVLTSIVVLGGAQDIAGQVLLASGIYALGRCLQQYGIPRPTRGWLSSIAATGAGWVLGLLAGAWLLLPLVEYATTGNRIVERSEGLEERPPTGWEALPEIVIPNFYGSCRTGSIRTGELNLLESCAGSYAGLVAALLVAPLAWCRRTNWANNFLWVILALVALAWSLDIPGLVHLLRLPVLNMMSHNRFVFVAAFAILALAASGLDVLWHERIVPRWWFLLPVILLAALGGWCAYRTVVLPEPYASELAAAVRATTNLMIRDEAGVLRVQQTFISSRILATAWCSVALGGWICLWWRKRLGIWMRTALGAVMLAELLWFGYGRSVQCDPALYYPRVPILDRVARDTPGRVLGFICLPANLAQSHGLCDLRGYDGVDPKRMVELLQAVASPSSIPLPYALTQWMSPNVYVDDSGSCELAPILNMLNVRYVIVRGTPPETLKPEVQDGDYWIAVNRAVLPRVFVPEHVGVIDDDAERLRRLSDNSFNPRRVAYVEERVSLPLVCRGLARMTEDTPTRITASLEMQTPGLVVLADRWDAGWNAYLDGSPRPILQTNHALRGVVVPAGTRTLQFRYEPESLVWGARISGLAILAWATWLSILGWTARRRSQAQPCNDCDHKE